MSCKEIAGRSKSCDFDTQRHYPGAHAKHTPRTRQPWCLCHLNIIPLALSLNTPASRSGTKAASTATLTQSAAVCEGEPHPHIRVTAHKSKVTRRLDTRQLARARQIHHNQSGPLCVAIWLIARHYTRPLPGTTHAHCQALHTHCNCNAHLQCSSSSSSTGTSSDIHRYQLHTVVSSGTITAEHTVLMIGPGYP